MIRYGRQMIQKCRIFRPARAVTCRAPRVFSSLLRGHVRRAPHLQCTWPQHGPQPLLCSSQFTFISSSPCPDSRNFAPKAHAAKSSDPSAPPPRSNSALPPDHPLCAPFPTLSQLRHLYPRGGYQTECLLGPGKKGHPRAGLKGPIESPEKGQLSRNRQKC